MVDSHLMPHGYNDFLGDLKRRVRQAQLRAVFSVNRELVLLYWEIGRQILERQQKEGWGTKVIDRLAIDLKHAFPEMKGFSPRNLKYMRAFAETYPNEPFVQEVLAQITWYHNITLLNKVKLPIEREWYVRQTIRYGWSRNILVHQTTDFGLQTTDYRLWTSDFKENNGTRLYQNKSMAIS